MLYHLHIKAVILGVIFCCTQALQRSQNRIPSEFCRAVSISSSNNVGAKSIPFNIATTTSYKPTVKSVNSQLTYKNHVSSESLTSVSISSAYNLDSKNLESNVMSTVPAKRKLGLVGYQNVHDQFVETIPSSSSLSIVYNASDITSYFMRNPSLVIGRVMQVMTEVATILVAAMEGMFQEGTDNGSVATPTLRKGRVKLAAAVRDSMIRMGPTFIKLGQALSSRQDLIGLEGISQLQLLQDAIPSTFTTAEAREIIRQDLMGRQGVDSDMLTQLLGTLSASPVAAASLGQVYRATVNGVDVAVKVQRPHLREQVAADFLIARWGATILSDSGFLRSDGVGAVDEYASRLFEELDYINEANNLKKFAALYAEDGTASETLPSPGILVPELLPTLCSDRVLTMTWLEGEKLIRKDATVSASDLPLVQLGIQCTLSQILETGVLHADPHGGNLLKGPGGKLAYLDFGLVASVPISVREALVCSVVHLVERNYSALAREFDSLMLMPADALSIDLKAFELALADVAEQVLDFSPRHNEQMQNFAKQKKDQNSIDFAIAVGRIVPVEILPEDLLVRMSKSVRGFFKNPVLSALITFLSLLEKSTASNSSVGNGGSYTQSLEEEDEDEDIATPIPRVKFDEIISALFAVATRFSFTVPPYFLNNVRAIGSLEGMALTADPNFSLLEVVYPYVLRKVLSDFSGDSVTKTKSLPDSASAAMTTSIDAVHAEEYVNLHDDSFSRLGAAAGQTTASGKTREVFRSLILRKDRDTGLLLPRWKRLRRFLRDASRTSMDVNMNSPLATATDVDITTGATVAYVKKGSKMGDKQIAMICKQFLSSVGGRALLMEITSNILQLWSRKIRQSVRSIGIQYVRQWQRLWSWREPKIQVAQARQ